MVSSKKTPSVDGHDFRGLVAPVTFLLATAAAALLIVGEADAADRQRNSEASSVEVPSLARHYATGSSISENPGKSLAEQQPMSITRRQDGATEITAAIHGGRGEVTTLTIPEIMANVDISGPAGVDENGNPISWRKKFNRAMKNAIAFQILRENGYTEEKLRKLREGKKSQADIWKEKTEATRKYVEEHGPITTKSFVIPGSTPEISDLLEGENVGVRMEDGRRIYYVNGRRIDPVKDAEPHYRSRSEAKKQTQSRARPLTVTRTHARQSVRRPAGVSGISAVQPAGSTVSGQENQVSVNPLKKGKDGNSPSAPTLERTARETLPTEAPSAVYEPDPDEDLRRSPLNTDLDPEGLPNANEVRMQIEQNLRSIFPDLRSRNDESGYLDRLSPAATLAVAAAATTSTSTSTSTMSSEPSFVNRSLSFLFGIGEASASETEDNQQANKANQANQRAHRTSARRNPGSVMGAFPVPNFNVLEEEGEESEEIAPGVAWDVEDTAGNGVKVELDDSSAAGIDGIDDEEQAREQALRFWDQIGIPAGSNLLDGDRLTLKARGKEKGDKGRNAEDDTVDKPFGDIIREIHDRTQALEKKILGRGAKATSTTTSSSTPSSAFGPYSPVSLGSIASWQEEGNKQDEAEDEDEAESETEAGISYLEAAVSSAPSNAISSDTPLPKDTKDTKVNIGTGLNFDPAEFAADVVNRTTKSLTQAQFDEDVAAMVSTLSEKKSSENLLDSLAGVLESFPEIYSVIPDADQKLQAMRGDVIEIVPPDPMGEQTLIFVSYSLSDEVLKDIIERHARRRDVTLVMRGIPDGMNIQDGTRKMQQLAASVTPPAAVVIDPPLFEAYGITQVPAVARVGRTPSKLLVDPSRPDGRRFAPLVAKVTGLNNDEWLMERIEAGEKGDLGVQGEPKEIAEPDLREEMKRRVALIDWEQKKQAALKRFWKNREYKVFPTAEEERIREIDPTILVERDLLDLAGRPIRKAGDRVNPLQIRPFTQTMLIFNPVSEEEMKRVTAFRKAWKDAGRTGLVLIATQIDGSREWEGYVELTDRLDSHVFVMTPEIEYTWRIERTPSVVTADNARHVFLVRELGRLDGTEHETLEGEKTK